MTEIMAKWLGFNRELFRILSEAQIRVLAVNDEERLVEHRKMNEQLRDALFRHDRELALLAGEKVEPVAHEAQAVLFPVPNLIKP